MKPWKEVIQSEAYKALPPQERAAAQQEYFDTVVAPKVPAGERANAHSAFFAQYPVEQPAPIQYSPPAPKPKEFSWTELAKNIPSSGAKWAQDMVGGLQQMVTSPIDTAAGLGKMAVGGLQRAIPGKQEWEQQYFDPVAEMYGDRYGSWEQFKQTAMQDPVGTLSDVALAPTAAGIGTKAAGLTARGAGALTGSQALSATGQGLSKAGGAMTATGAALDPLNLAWNTVVRPPARALGKIAIDETLPATIYGRGAKWPMNQSITPEARLNLGETALREGIRPYAKGSKKLDRLIDDMTTELNAKLDEATAAGSMISRDSLFKYFDDTLAKYGSEFRLSGEKSAKVINQMRDRYIQNIDKVTGGETLLTPKQVQDFKIDVYEDLKAMNAFGSPKKTAKGKKAGMKAAARAAKEELEEVAPGIDMVNQRLSDLYALREAMPRPVNRLANLNEIPLGAPLRTGAGAAIGGMIGGPVGAKVGMGLGAAATAIDMPSVKFATAESLYRVLNDPVIDMSVKRKALASLRQISAELEQLSEANPGLFPIQ